MNIYSLLAKTFKKQQAVFYVVMMTAFISFNAIAQVGINTSNPKGALDVTSINNTGMVIPRVSAVEDVTDGNANPPLNGTTVFDLSRNTTCFYLNNSWVCIEKDSNGDPVLTDQTPGFNNNSIDYIKASNTGATDIFGVTVAISADGTTLAVGSPYEGSNAMGINGNELDNSAPLSGAVYVFERVATVWTQQAYIKASNTESFDAFSYNLDLSHDGNTLAVSAIGEDSNATGVDGDQTNNATLSSGAVYVFNRSGTTWMQESFIKSSNTDFEDVFGVSVAISGDGNTLAIGTGNEDSNATGVNGIQSNNASNNSGAVYIFVRTGGTWIQEAYLKASNGDPDDRFGDYLSISGDGNTLAVGAGAEDSNATGINGDQTNNVAASAGALYVFARSGTTWSQQAYVKASNTDVADMFASFSNNYVIALGRGGTGISLSNDGNVLAVGSGAESSNATGVNGDQTNNSAILTGAVYVFERTGTTWSQQAYIKASNSEAYDFFGTVVELSGDGTTLAIASTGEDSNATGINGDQTDNSIPYAGAVYLFKKNGGTWTQESYIKATNTGIDPWTSDGDSFGYFMVLSNDGNTLAVGAPLEDSDATGINGNQTDNSVQDAGAVYIYTSN